MRAGHRWEAPPATIRAGHWCSQCWYLRQRDTLERMQEIAASRGGLCLSDEYVNQRQPLRWRCAHGHEWESPAAIVKGHWCQHCQRENSRTSIERMREIATERGGLCLSERYVNAGSYLQWQCTHGHIWDATATKIQQGQWCPYCSGHRHLLADMQALAQGPGWRVPVRCLREDGLQTSVALRPWAHVGGNTCDRGQRKLVPALPARTQPVRHMERMHELAAQRGGLCLSERYLFLYQHQCIANPLIILKTRCQTILFAHNCARRRMPTRGPHQIAGYTPAIGTNRFSRLIRVLQRASAG